MLVNAASFVCGGFYSKTCPSSVHEFRECIGKVFSKMYYVEPLMPTIFIRSIGAMPIQTVTDDEYIRTTTNDDCGLMTDDCYYERFRVPTSESETVRRNV